MNDVDEVYTMYKTSLFIAACLAVASAVELEQPRAVNLCLEQKSCSQCMSASSQCQWCLKPDFPTSRRCDLLENLHADNCSKEYVYSPDSTLIFHKNEQPRNGDDTVDPVQLSPQNITIKLRPNKAFQFPMTFRLAENYPVDLYFLMDVSRTMRDYKENLVALSEQLAYELSQLTTNYRLGLGTFVDKTTMPYASTDQISSWCSDCALPYGFRNHLRLTNNISEFRRKVNETEMSGNVDAPEGSFDAIMQAIACKKRIGWRSRSRKMIVVSTDASFHYAGDGKLGGIVAPNDGQCHLNDEGEYTESVTQDYPSISQLSQKIAEHKVHVIFAVPQVQVSLYEQLISFIEGSTVGVLTETSNNVVDLVRDNYKQISSTIEMKTEGSGHVQVHFRSKCLGDIPKETNKCDNLLIGRNVTFEVRLEVKSCPQDQHHWTTAFQIYPLGLTEKLTVTLHLHCQCPCETSMFQELNSEQCNGNGTYQCSICVCNDGYYGDRCQCDSDSLSAATHEATCRMNNGSEVCEGRGLCECGKCVCNVIRQTKPNQKYSGEFCQCDNYNCDHFNSKLCGGTDRGQCVCGKCLCQEGYEGSACECPTSNSSCIASNGKLCNDQGYCHCGECRCKSENNFYKGRTCEDCPTCPGKCDKNSECVKCFFKHPDDICRLNCTNIEQVDSIKGGDEWHNCHIRDDDYCFIHFAYNYNSETVQVQRTKECTKPVDVRLIIVGVVVGILAVGIALLFTWKAFVTIHDRREYARFEAEAKKARWDVQLNPIYRNATTTYKNPTFISAQNQ